MQIGYCGNVHPGKTLDEVKQNLTDYALPVKKRVRPDSPMGIGLWLSATALEELSSETEIYRFRDWLSERELLAFTFNGFPFGDFHQEVVKHDVYLPSWAEPSRMEYTIRLAEIQNLVLPHGISGTISTLPLGWPDLGDAVNDSSFLERCADQLRKCAKSLADIEEKSGRHIRICIEPEPGCWLDTCDDVTGFFHRSLLTGNRVEDQMILNHIGVCHDICHSAVMFEDQATAINAYQQAGLAIGKVQVSSAIKVNFGELPEEQHQPVLDQLASFAEPKYLHQTSIRNDGETEFFVDLPDALDNAADGLSGQWRVHFHVPIFCSQLDAIGTTQTDISDCIAALHTSQTDVRHFEIETYAWNVLPQRLKQEGLAADIATEIQWFDRLMGRDLVV